MHVSKKTEELIKSNVEFEDYSLCHGVQLHSICPDDVGYTTKIVAYACSNKQQCLTFCTIGSHWQHDSIAECFIGSTLSGTSTLYLPYRPKRSDHILSSLVRTHPGLARFSCWKWKQEVHVGHSSTPQSTGSLQEVQY
jgi:hypothetical protein